MSRGIATITDHERRARRRDRATGLFALLPAAAAGGGLALAPLLGLAGAAALQPRLIARDLARPPLWLILLALFTTWMALSALWSPFGSAVQALKFTLTISTGLLFARAATRAPRLMMAASFAAILVLAALLAGEAIFDMPLNRAANPGLETWQLAGNPGRGAAVLTALIWAGLGYLMLARLWPAALIALGLAGLLASQFGQSANIIAFAAGAGAFVLGYAAPRAGLMATGAVLAGWVLAAPWATPLALSALSSETLPYSWAARVEIWRYVAARIAEQPWFGHGLDASRMDGAAIIVHGQRSRAIPLHPHSAALQIWFEIGAVGRFWPLARCSRALGASRARLAAAAPPRPPPAPPWPRSP